MILHGTAVSACHRSLAPSFALFEMFPYAFVFHPPFNIDVGDGVNPFELSGISGGDISGGGISSGSILTNKTAASATAAAAATPLLTLLGQG